MMDKHDTVKMILRQADGAKLEKVEAELDKLAAEIRELSPGLDYVRKLEIFDHVRAIHYVLTHYKIERIEKEDN